MPPQDPMLPRFAGNLTPAEQRAILQQQEEIQRAQTWSITRPSTWPAHARNEVAAQQQAQENEVRLQAALADMPREIAQFNRMAAAFRATQPDAPLTGLDLARAQGLPDYAVPSATETFNRLQAGEPYVPPQPQDPSDPVRPGGPGGPGGPAVDPAAIARDAAAAAAAAAQQSWQAMLEEQRREAERLRQQLEAEYRSRKADLRQQFEFAETEQERAQLAFLMNTLDDALTAGEQAISAGYNSARAQVTQLARASQDAAAVEQAAVEGLFSQAAGQLSGRVQDLAQQVGPGAGLMGDALSGAEDFYNLLATDAAREAALGQRLSGIIGRDIAAGQERMTLQEASQQADLARSGMQTRASLTAQQQAAVAQRIAEDRRTFVNALQRLQSDISARGGQVDMSALGTYDRAAQLAFSEADTARRLAADAQQQASAFAFQREMMDRDREERLARGETPEFEREMLDFARNLQVWNSLPDEIKTPDLWSEIFGRDLPS